MPCRPATPRISPRRRVEAGVAQLARRPRASRTPRTSGATAGRRAAGRGGKVCASERPMIISMTSSSLKSATGAGGDVAAVAQHRQPVAEGAHLAHAVRDEDDGDAARRSAGDDARRANRRRGRRASRSARRAAGCAACGRARARSRSSAARRDRGRATSASRSTRRSRARRNARRRDASRGAAADQARAGPTGA